MTCKDSPESPQDTPPVPSALGDITRYTNIGESGNQESLGAAEFVDPITRLALEAMREAEENPNVLTHNLLLALSTSDALRGVSNKEQEMRAEIARINENRQELLDLILKQQIDNCAVQSMLVAEKEQHKLREAFSDQCIEAQKAALQEALNKVVALEKELEEAIAQIGITASRYTDDIEKLDAQCAAMREALETCVNDRCKATAAEELLRSTDAGAALLKRLEAAEEVCETLEGMHLILGNECGPLLDAWKAAKEQE